MILALDKPTVIAQELGVQEKWTSQSLVLKRLQTDRQYLTRKNDQGYFLKSYPFGSHSL